MTTFNTTKCTEGKTWTAREMTEEEMNQIARSISGYGNATVTGVHFAEGNAEVWFAVNYHSQAKYPNNHREYQAVVNTTPAEWQGWN